MTNPQRDKRFYAWLALFTFVVAGWVWAQPGLMAEEPELFKLRFTDVSLLLDAEDRMETRTAAGEGRPFRRDTRELSPSLRVGADGSVYHPNFLSYNLFVREGLYWEDVRIESVSVTNRHGRSVLQDYDARITMLRKEPYAVRLFAARHDVYRDYDFFTRVKVDDQTFGGSAGYQAGPVPFLVTATHSRQNVDDSTRPSSLTDDSVLFTARNRRATSDYTDFRYSFNRFRRDEEDLATQDGQRHQARLSDAERFGKDNRSSLSSSLSYNSYESSSAPLSYYSAQEGLTLRHSETLRSIYDYSYDGNRSDAASGDNHQGRASLNHQLYESLFSSVDVHGGSEQSDGEDSSRESTTYGAGIDERYVKRLSTWGRLNLGYHGQLDRRTQGGSGDSTAVVGETHVMRDGTMAFLNQLYADTSTIVVKDMSGAVIYRELLDYRVIPRGTRVELQRVVGGTIPNGATVRVDYIAAGQPSAKYDTRSDAFDARMELFHGVLGVYGRVRLMRNHGDLSTTYEDLDDKTVGMDLSWRWLRAGAEYEDYDSSLTPYSAVRLFQSLTCPVTDWSSLGVNARETSYSYRDPDRERDTYEFVGRYRVRCTFRLGFGLEGGVHIDRGEGIDRRLNTTRANIDYALGQMTMRLNYELQDETYSGDDRERRTITLSARRSF
jgi:hypothetical protein